MQAQRHVDAFVIMPFGNSGEYRDGNRESNYVFKTIITPGIHAAFGDDVAVKIRRQVDENSPGSITAAIVRNLARADVLVADLTGRNPNVFLELGIRFSLRNRVTILMAQEGTLPPFDVADYRVIFYSVVDPLEAQKQLASTIRDSFEKTGKVDSLVFDSFGKIAVQIPGFCESYGLDSSGLENAMLWTEYWERVCGICSWLEEPSRSGQFSPDAVIGISNGGLVVADLVGRRLFRGTPILSLWANRFSRREGANDSCWFFDNPYNDAVVSEIRSRVGKRRPRILLLDDHLGTGTTARQAERYFKERFGENTLVLYIPMFSNRPEYTEVVEDLLPYKYEGGRVFPAVTKEVFWESVKTSAAAFPYDKEISSGP